MNFGRDKSCPNHSTWLHLSSPNFISLWDPRKRQDAEDRESLRSQGDSYRRELLLRDTVDIYEKEGPKGAKILP